MLVVDAELRQQALQVLSNSWSEGLVAKCYADRFKVHSSGRIMLLDKYLFWKEAVAAL
jgi:hypothetical protein